MSSALFNGILWNASLFNGIGTSPDPAEQSVAWSGILAELYPRLHATDASTLVWWEVADLERWAAEALQALSRGALLFVRREVQSTANGQRLYGLPFGHLATLHAAWNAKPMQATDYALIDALDSAADAATGDPKRWYQDGTGVHAFIGLWPTPSTTQTLAIIFAKQEQISEAMPIPRCMRAWIADWILAEAWAHDSDFAMPELAEHFRSKRELYLSVYQQYWGSM